MIPENAIPTLFRDPATGEWRVVGYRIPSKNPEHELDLSRVVSPTGKRLWKAVCPCGWSGNDAYKITAAIDQGFKHHLDRLPAYCPQPKKAAYKTEAEANKALIRVWQKAPDEKVPLRPYECECGRWHLTSKVRHDEISEAS